MTIDEFVNILRRGQKYKAKSDQYDPTTGIQYYRDGDTYKVNLGYIDGVTGKAYGNNFSFPFDAFEPDFEELEDDD